MKNKFSKLMLVFCLFFYISCWADSSEAHSGNHFIACPKTYVKPEQIEFYKNEIFVQINGGIIETESISSDAQGIFFKNVRDNSCGPSQWKCKKRLEREMSCDTCNWDWNYTCSYCGGDKR